ncbi:MAG: anaerobic glycerol-3-phosphate dehydrogenase subunit GlpA [Schaalia hyovaginalis]|uniref:anaerobic glycerol-3-phosphate dehydrogenase subunit GlpA n=1 Tax=Schaalia hyovaginalis TaxID=29316 RepID=UPI0023F70C01|nr:anaerobic glycerol-3-phosphate dehydrogenase subunit GlpA [Schaalia hyovaginalis]MCI7672637.1 anaerobic glycerol-3-phosphate dehydrogenase subunit A [Schaalia hyovaginalis]MDY5506574.1 anaerobic glycerol-3-phosphate dehydrogenase subunit GlpA [Schaalia hyovaginalis]
MKTINTDVVVIGGGSTGAGVVRDVAMRGFRAVLVERYDIAQGTSGRFHGLLHSGGRYIASDPESATECAEENLIVKKINANAVEDTGGLFVVTSQDDEEYADKFLERAAAAKVPAQEISVAEALKREPRLDPKLKRAFEVLDGSVDGWQMVWGAIRSAQAYGAQVLTYHKVTNIEREGDAVSAVVAHDLRTGEDVHIECSFVLNCGGPWAGQIAALADCHGVDVVPGAGIMVAMNFRLTQTVLNRCIWPADGDIIVPDHPVCIIGTTDLKADDPDKLAIPADQVQQMLDAGEAMIPGFRKARPLHAWAGARPLVKDSRVAATDTRHMARGMSVIDHKSRDGVSGLLTIAGGKLTTYRLMAERIVDIMCDEMGEKRECRTAGEAVPAASDHRLYTIGHRLESVEHDNAAPSHDQIICECELVTRAMLETTMDLLPGGQLDDVRRQVRLGMGPCQGGFCSQRATGIAHERGDIDSVKANELFRTFLKNRWIGLWPIVYGKQLRQTALDNWIHEGALDVEHLPSEELDTVKEDVR